ncbi:putative isomerase YbhE [Fusarium bulbicola]|nr:putative isomerase YbhE [Fusarium bulbicola]
MFSLAVIIIMLLAYEAVAESQIHILRVAHQERGILTLDLNPSEPRNRSIQLVGTTRAGYQPGWLHNRGGYLYSVSRTYFPDNSSTSGGIYAFRKLPNGCLELHDAVASHGDGGVYLDITRDGKTLSSANIDGSTVSIFPLTSSGNFGHVANVFHYNLTHPGPGAGDSQEVANPHAAILSPCGNIMAVPDRGADRVYIYQVRDAKHVEQIRTITLLPGTGPRHIVFSQVSKEKRLMFLVSELDNTVNVFSLENGPAGHHGTHPELNETLRITHLQRASTLDGSSKRTKPNNVNLASELSVSHDKRFLYVSNRNTESVDKADTIAVYSLDGNLKKPLQFLGLNSTYGKIPRHFSLSLDSRNQFVAVANQVTNDLFILKRDFKTGFLDGIVGNYSFGKLDLTTRVGPMAVMWD